MRSFNHWEGPWRRVHFYSEDWYEQIQELAEGPPWVSAHEEIVNPAAFVGGVLTGLFLRDIIVLSIRRGLL